MPGAECTPILLPVLKHLTCYRSSIRLERLLGRLQFPSLKSFYSSVFMFQAIVKHLPTISLLTSVTLSEETEVLSSLNSIPRGGDECPFPNLKRLNLEHRERTSILESFTSNLEFFKPSRLTKLESFGLASSRFSRPQRSSLSKEDKSRGSPVAHLKTVLTIIKHNPSLESLNLSGLKNEEHYQELRLDPVSMPNLKRIELCSSSSDLNHCLMKSCSSAQLSGFTLGFDFGMMSFDQMHHSSYLIQKPQKSFG